MKILFFTDTHASEIAMNKLKKKANNAELIVCAGDISIFEHEIDKMMKEIASWGKKVLMIHGNHESASTFREFCNKHKNLIFIHNKLHYEDNILFIGYGGGGFSYREKGFEKLIKENLKEIKKAEKVVLVTHAPPHNTKIDIVLDSHCGNKSVRDFIKKLQPTLSISGHLHENNSKADKIGSTKVVNPGPFGKLITI